MYITHNDGTQLACVFEKEAVDLYNLGFPVYMSIKDLDKVKEAVKLGLNCLPFHDVCKPYRSLWVDRNLLKLYNEDEHYDHLEYIPCLPALERRFVFLYGLFYTKDHLSPEELKRYNELLKIKEDEKSVNKQHKDR